MEESFTVHLKCLFCDSPLEGKKDKEYSAGDMLECQNCHELNDYDSLLEIAKEEGTGLVKDQLEKELQKTLGNMFKK